MSEHAPSSLAQKILRETSRFALLQVFGALLAAAANVLLARLLERRDFGTYDICSFWIGIGSVLGDGGLGATLMRRKRGVSRRAYQVTLTTLLMVAVVMGCVLFFAAPFIATRYHLNSHETNALRAMAPLYFVNAFRVVPYIRLERELKFARIARIELTSAIVRHVVAITLAVTKGGVWALIVSNIVGASLQLALAYQASPGWVGIGWAWRTFRPLIAYGGQVQALGICSYFKDRISPALLGAVLGPSAVGVFDFGLAYIQVPVTAVNALARVQLPVYARLHAHDPTLYSALRGATRAALLLGVPALVMLPFAAPWVVPNVYNPRWVLAYPVIWGLVANMVGGLVASPLFTLLQGQGRARLAIGVFVGWTFSTWLLAALSVWRFPGNLGLVAAAHSVVTVVIVLGLIRWAGIHLKRGLFASFSGPIIAGGAALAVGFVQQRYAPGLAHHPLLVALGCLAAYVVTLLSLEGRSVIAEVKVVIRGVKGDAST